MWRCQTPLASAARTVPWSCVASDRKRKVSAAWSTRAAPWAVVVGAVLLVPGLLSIVYAVLVLAHGGAAWGMPAYACMVCAVALACLRLWRDLRSQSITLSWDPAHG